MRAIKCVALGTKLGHKLAVRHDCGTPLVFPCFGNVAMTTVMCLDAPDVRRTLAL